MRQKVFSGLVLILLPLILISCATAPIYNAASTSIYDAAIANNAALVRQLIDQGANLEYAPYGLTPLMGCCYQGGNPEVVRLLVNAGANINAVNPLNKFTPLMYAAAYGHLEAVNILLTAGADINARDNKGKTAADYAQQYKRIEVLALLRKSGAPVSYTGNAKSDLLMAAVGGDREKMFSLLEQGGDSNLKDKEGKSMLMYAQENNWLEVTDLLLKKGANADARDKYGWTAQMQAARENKSQMLEIFADNKVKIPYSGKPKEDLLLTILFADYTKAQTLISQGADVNACYRFNSPLLNYAAARNDLQAVKLLLENKANPNKFNDYGRSALWAAASNKNLAMLELMVNHGADLNLVNAWGVNALMNALVAKDLDAARYLLDKTINVNAVQKQGFSVLQYAILTGDLEIVQKLLEKGAQADPLCVVLAEGRNQHYKNINYPEIAALFKQDVLRRQMLRAQAAVESAQSPADYQKAQAEYSLAMEVDPTFPEIYYNLGLIQDKAGQFEAAIINLRHYLKLYPLAPDRQAVQDIIYKIEYKRDAAK